MDISHLCTQLARTGQTILGLTEGVDDDSARIRYRADAWSIVEVMCHLYDEEREDFRVRVMYPLTTPHLPIPGIAPAEWVHSRHYATQALSRVRQQFRSERIRSIQQLHALVDPQWQTHLNHPRLAELTARDMAWSWLAHDLLHIRQLNELNYLHLSAVSSSPFIGYAGDW
jgi:hypothetical protein